MIELSIIIVLCFLWACYVARMKVKSYGWSWKLAFSWLVNFIICPLSMILFIKRGVEILNDKDGKKVYDGDWVWLYDRPGGSELVLGQLKYDPAFFAYAIKGNGKRYLLMDNVGTFKIVKDKEMMYCVEVEKAHKKDVEKRENVLG